MSPASNQGSNGGISDEPRGIIETAIFKRKGDLLMQKKIIALAVAGLMSGAAFAQSNVTVYGVVDGYYANGKATNTTDDKFSGINGGGLSGSRIGFKGVEDLGGGLKAAFVLEAGTLDSTANASSQTLAAPNTVTTTTNGIDGWRQAYVGLVGGFGTAVIGRLQTPGYDFAAKYDAHGASIFSPVGQLTDNIGLTISARDALGRLDNAVAYISPNMGGVTAKVAYAFGEQVKGAGTTSVPATDYDKQQTALALSADYDNGPLSVGGVYHDVNNVSGTLVAGARTDLTEWALGAKYNFGMITPFFSYQNAKLSVAGANTKTKIWNLGARANVSAAGSVGLAYAKSSQSEGNDDKGTSWGLDYQHNLSKRTTVYAGYSTIKSKNGAAYELQNLKGSAFGQTVSAGADMKSNQYAVGVRHTF
jgi:predicted porin